MARPKIDVEVRGDTKPLRRDIDKISSKSVNLDLNSKNFSAPLGKIKGELGEFDKSLAASNARVLAFGASAGAIYAIERALTETVRATIQVEKSLAEVNVILGTSQKKLAGFGNELFNIAKKTGRSFQDVALAGGELARQGLAMEETLKRTSDAMILARLSGLGVEESVNAITAALNGFRNAALSSTAVVDKLIAVDQAFAVSGADLAEALRRVGSTAEGAGVSLNELLGIVTAAQQITARGGAVIGNSFKTIFTRIQRPRVLSALDELGVKTKNAAGASLSATQILKNLANTFDRLGEAQQAQIAELVGGVFQINVLKASLRDLGSQYSVFTSATEIASRAQGESAKRNAELNKTLAAGLNETLQNLTQLAAGVGKLTFEPAIRNVLGLVNFITTKLSGSKEAEEGGKGLAQTLLGGLGKFLAGPGLAIAGVALFQLFNNLRKFAVDAFNTFSGLNQSFREQRQLQQGILNILQQNPKVLAQIQRGEISVDQAAQQILGSYKHLNAELVSMNNVATQLANNMTRAGAQVGKVKGTSTITTGGKASGYIPNFADQGEVAAMALSGMYTKGQMSNPQTRRGRIFDGQGGSFMATYNGHEKKKDMIGPNGKKGTVIMSPAMQKALAHGFIPNFVRQAKIPLKEVYNQGTKSFIGSRADVMNRVKGVTEQGQLSTLLNSTKLQNAPKNSDGAILYAAAKAKNKQLARKGQFPSVRLGGGAAIFTTGISGGGNGFLAQDSNAKKILKGTGIKNPPLGFHLTGIPQVNAAQNISGGLQGGGFDNLVKKEMEPAFVNLARALAGGGFDKKDIPSPISKLALADDKSGFPQFVGRVFETTVNGILGKTPASGATWDYLRGDFNAKTPAQKNLYGAIFKDGLRPLQKAKYVDAKRSGFGEYETMKSVSGKIAKTSVLTKAIGNQLKTQGFKASGYIPNFAGGPLGDAIRRENNAGVSMGAIRVGSDRRLASGSNPFGFAVTNTRDEPRGLKDVLANGYVPNFVATGFRDIGAGTSPGLNEKNSQSSQKVTDSNNKNAESKNRNTASTNKQTMGSEKLFGVMMIASLVTNTLSEATEGASEGMQKTTSALNAGVNGLMGFVAVTSMVSGTMGKLYGILLGGAAAFMSFSNSLKAAPSAYTRNAEAIEEATVRLKEQGDAIQQTQQALSAYTEALEGSDAREIQAAQKKYTAALLKLEPALRTQIMTLTDSEDKQAALGKAAAETAQDLTMAQKSLDAQKQTIAAINKSAKEKTLSNILNVGGKILAVLGTIHAVMALNNYLTKSTAAKQMVVDSQGEVREAAADAAQLAAQNATTAAVISGAGADVASDVGLVGGGAAAGGIMAGFSAAVASAVAVVGTVTIALAALAGAIAIAVVAFKAFETFKAVREAREAEEKFLTSKYEDPSQPGLAFSPQGKRQMQADAAQLLKVFDDAFKEANEKAGGTLNKDDELLKIRRAATGRAGMTSAENEEAMIQAFEKLGVEGLKVSGIINGMGGFTSAVGQQMLILSKNAEASEEQLRLLQEALDRNAAATAAANQAIIENNQRFNALANIMQVMAMSAAKAQQQVAQFNRDFDLEVLKGGAKLAEQFSTSFQNTAREGMVKRMEINEDASKKATKIREKGTEDMFKALSGQSTIKSLFEKVDAGGPDVTQAEQELAGRLRGLQAGNMGKGAGEMMQEFSDILTQAALPGMALEGQKVGLGGLGLEKILGQQYAAMQEAERTRQQQLRMSELQTQLQQAQNKIDQQAKAGGGIEAFLNPERMDDMEDSFNTSLSDFITASNRGDSVKTGQAAGNLLGNLNEFMGADLMGPAADKLKDQVEGGLAQSLRGRAFARADMLDQAAAQTGDSSLSELADTLRNQNFAEIAATQTALEFKRQQMPDNIAQMLGVQSRLEALQTSDLAENVRTANATTAMAQFLTGGAFTGALAGLAGRVGAAQAGGSTQDILGTRPTSGAIGAQRQGMQDFISANNRRRQAQAEVSRLTQQAGPNNEELGKMTASELEEYQEKLRKALSEAGKAAEDQSNIFAALSPAQQRKLEVDDLARQQEMGYGQQGNPAIRRLRDRMRDQINFQGQNPNFARELQNPILPQVGTGGDRLSGLIDPALELLQEVEDAARYRRNQPSMVTPTPVNQNISTIPTLSTGQLEDEMDIAAKFISSPNPDRSLLDRGRMKTQPPMSDEAKKTREDIEKKLLENASRLLENAETMAVFKTLRTRNSL